MDQIKHPCVPQSMTPENLAQWITTQKVDNRKHVEEIELTEEEIQKFEHDSSLASRSIDTLKEVEKHFKALLKKGTPYDRATELHKPATVTIPPTKGLDALTANREYADAQIKSGVKQDITDLYLIPYPETSRMIMVNIVGVEWPEYSRDMTPDELNQYKPLLKVTKNETLADTAKIKKEGMTKDELFPSETPEEDKKDASDLPFN